jgi:GNAT superfamily N-acetyltransferase
VKLTFTFAQDSDLDDLVALHACAYPDARSYEQRRRNFTHHTLGRTPLQNVLVAKTPKGTIAGHARLFDLELHAWSHTWKVGGIASVAVAPEYRGTGVAGALLDHLHALSRKRDQIGTLLYAFRDKFYARAEYVQLAPFAQLEFAPQALAQTEKVVARATARDIAGVKAAYTRAGLNGIGYIARSDRRWERRLLDERLHTFVIKQKSTVEGYVMVHYEQADPHAETCLVVEELIAETPDVRRQLLGFLRSQRDQVSKVRMQCSLNDAIIVALSDPDQGQTVTSDLAHPFGQITSGPMFRPHTLEGLLAVYPFRTDGTFRFGLRGRTVEIQVRKGNALITHSAQAPDANFANAQTLVRLLTGGLLLSEAETLGLAKAAPSRQSRLERLREMLRAERFYSLDPF